METGYSNWNDGFRRLSSFNRFESEMPSGFHQFALSKVPPLFSIQSHAVQFDI